MIIENFLERIITHWIPFVFGYLITPFRYVYHFVIERPLTFGFFSLIVLVLSIAFFLSDKFFDRVEKHVSILYIDLLLIISSVVLLGFVVIGLDFKY